MSHKDPEQRKLYALSYYQRNKEKELVRAQTYRAANADKVKETQRRYSSANKEKIRATRKIYEQGNRERLTAGMKRYRDAHKDELRGYNRARSLLRYGLTPDSYAALLAGQNGACAVCGAALDDRARPAIDHCHDTGRVRAILCQGCNIALGHVRDDPKRLRKLANYVEKHTIEGLFS